MQHFDTTKAVGWQPTGCLHGRKKKGCSLATYKGKRAVGWQPTGCLCDSKRASAVVWQLTRASGLWVGNLQDVYATLKGHRL